MVLKSKARELLVKFKGDNYTFGIDILGKVGVLDLKQIKSVISILLRILSNYYLFIPLET